MFDVKGLLDPIVAIINKVIPDKSAQVAAVAQLQLLQMQGALNEELIQLQSVTSAQSAINQVEAANASLFVSGWRPMIGWVCAAALAYQYLASPLAAGAANILGHPIDPLPSLDGQLWELMFGMLGMGTLRTVEKLKK